MTTTTDPQWQWLVGQRVTIASGGEEYGWDDDRGRPEFISPEVKITGTVRSIHPMRLHPTRVCVDLDEPTEWADQEWTDVHAVIHVHTPYDDEPHTAEIIETPSLDDRTLDEWIEDQQWRL